MRNIGLSYNIVVFIPVFGCQADDKILSVSLFSLTDISDWSKASFAVIIGATVLIGFFESVIGNFDKPVWNKRLLLSGIMLSALGTAVFILTRQPYAGIFYFSFLLMKGFFARKSR
jgi:hypothetical protein